MLPATMQALQLKELGRLEQTTLTVPPPRPGEILIRTVAATICTSDIGDIEHNHFGMALPRVIGHEGAGIVAAVGSGVDTFRVGNRVASHPVIPCGHCASCSRGLRHLCEDMGHLGYDRDGVFAEYYRIPATCVRAVPDGIDLAVASLLEPVAVCLEAVKRARISAGDNVLVSGDGPFGLLISRLCLRELPANVILAGTEEFRLRQAGKAIAIDVRYAVSVPDSVREITGGVDAAILAVASAQAFDDCLRSLRPRGRLVVFANLTGATPVDLSPVHIKELEILGACNDEDLIDEFLAALPDPELDLAGLITHRVPFAQWREAFDLAAHRKSEVLKVTMIFSRDNE